MSPPSVPKPPNAGQSRVGLAITRLSYVNLRTGPGTQYTAIGEIRNRTLVTYYPGSNTDGWIWLEQYGAAGWVSTSVIEFEAVSTPPVDDFPTTPYDGGVAIWHWKGQAIPETTIEAFATNLKRNAPNVKHVFVKVGDGSSWQGEFDSGDLAINNVQDIDRWVQTLSRHGLNFHAWVVNKGIEIEDEADIIIQTCKRPGVRSMILDIEPFRGYWQAGREPIRPLMTRVRREVGGSFHIGMAVDPRQWHYDSIFPDEWFPFVNSVHPMCYWRSFRRTPEEVIQDAYTVWGTYGRPIIPILQADASVDEQREAHQIVTTRFRAKGVSWWRYGVVSQWDGINTAVNITDPPPTDPTELPPPGTQFGSEVTIFAGGAGHRSGTYTGRDEFIRFRGASGWDAFYTSTEPQISKVWAEWRTDLPASGLYQISVFIPTQHSTTQRARYKIHGIRGTTTEVVVDINQSVYRNIWVSLGVFDLVKGAPNAGRVFLNDVTGETGREIAFDAVRLREIVRLNGSGSPGPIPDMIDGVYVADGFDSPVGTFEERRGERVWPEGWRDASPFAELYFVGTPQQAYHTGADLNFGRGGYDDLGEPVYAPTSGVVIYQSDLRPWGNVTIIRHDPLRAPTGRVYYTRYGHMQNLIVNVGDRVRRGQQIGEIGNGGGRYVPHLHYDIVQTAVLETKPGDWPMMDLNRVLRDYVDPLKFTRENRPGK